VYAIDTALVITVSFLAGISFYLVSQNKVILAALVQIFSGYYFYILFFWYNKYN